MVSLKKWGQIAGLMGLIQSVIWIGMSFAFLIVHDLEIEYEYSNHSFSLTFYESFVKKEEDGANTVSIFMIIYLLVSLFWFAASIYLIKTVNLKSEEAINLANTKRYSHLVWSVITFFVCVLDIVFTVSITTGFIKVPYQKHITVQTSPTPTSRTKCHKTTPTLRFLPRGDLFWVSLVKRQAPSYAPPSRISILREAPRQNLFFKRQVRSGFPDPPFDHDPSESRLSGYLKQFASPNRTKDIHINDSFVAKELKRPPDHHYAQPEPPHEEPSPSTGLTTPEPVLTETPLELHDLEEPEYDSKPDDFPIFQDPPQKIGDHYKETTQKESFEAIETTKIDRFQEFMKWRQEMVENSQTVEDDGFKEEKLLRVSSKERNEVENRQKIAKEIELYKSIQGNATTQLFRVTPEETKEIKDPFYDSFGENDGEDLEDINYLSFEKTDEKVGGMQKVLEGVKKVEEELDRLGPGLVSKIIEKNFKESQEKRLRPFPEAWRGVPSGAPLRAGGAPQHPGGAPPRPGGVPTRPPRPDGAPPQGQKFRDDSNESDELDLDLEDFFSTTERTTKAVRFYQQLPVQPSNLSGILILPDRMVRNVTIFAMLLVASRFGVLLLLNFLLTLVSFYLSIRYAQIYREQKEQSNQRATRRQSSRPNLFNEFEASSPLCVSPLDKKVQAPNKNIAFVIPMNKD